MYTKTVGYKDFKNKPWNEQVQFNLEVREVFPLLEELQEIFAWQESIKTEQKRTLTTPEVIKFYNAFETVLLAAWGVLDDDGKHFRKTGRFDFEESKLFAACMEMFVSEPEETGKLIEGILPEGLAEIAKKAEGNLDKIANDPKTPDVVRAEIARLQAQLDENEAD